MNQDQFKYEFVEENILILKAIAHPLRLRLVQELLQRGTCNVTQLQEVLKIPQSTVSQHLTKLKQNKVVQFERRGLEVYYQIRDPRIHKVIHTLFAN